MKWLSLFFTIVLIAGCFATWVSIESKKIIVTGFHAEAIGLGKPAIMHIILSSLFILLLLFNKIWSLRAAFFISAFNIAWAIRNFILVSACSGGECPIKHIALYGIVLASVLATGCLLLTSKAE